MHRAIVIVLAASMLACATDHPSADEAAVAPDAFVAPDLGAATDAALGADLGTSDAGSAWDGGAPVDTGQPADAGPDVGPPPPPPVTVSSGTPSLACVGSVTRPAGDAFVAASVTVEEFLSMSAVVADTVDVADSAAIPSSCAPACWTITTDATGQAPLIGAVGDWLSVHFHPTSTTADVRSYGTTWTGAPIVVDTFAPSTIATLAALFGRSVQTASAGVVVGEVVDCARQPLANVEPRIYVGTTRILTGALSDRTSPRVGGVEGTSPTRNGLTGSGGSFVGVNVPAGAFHVELWGVASAGASEALLACEEGELVAGGATSLVIGMLRADYPAGSACALAPRH
jgi:hypothetical protein